MSASSATQATDRASELSRRLPWLLVFRAAVATALLLLTLAADFASWPLPRTAGLLYGVVLSSFLVVLVLAVLLRAGVWPGLLSTVHLVSVVLAAGIVVHSTGGIESTFSFLLVLTVFDGAILGGQPVALVMALGCCAVYGLELALWGRRVASVTTLVNAGVSHAAAFYLSAWLAGHLAVSWRRAREEARTARSDLHRAEVLHAHVMQSLPVGVAVVDPAGRVRLANRALERIVGAGVGVSTGAPLPAVLADFMQQQQAHGTGEMPLGGGQTRHLAMARSPLRWGEQPEPEEVPLEVLVVDDITQLRALEESLRAREKMASLGALSAAIAHELRNPLAAISGCVELFRSSGPNDGERDKLACIVLREIERLNTLVSDFLAYARPAQPSRQPVDVAELVREVCEVMRQDGRWREHAIAVRGVAEAEALADPGQLRQVVWNLLKNALEASPRGAPVELQVIRHTGMVTVEVDDVGPGVDAEVKAHLFEPFRTTKEQGSGLGLAIVHTIVQAHGGLIEVTDRDGPGTQVRVSLPAIS